MALKIKRIYEKKSPDDGFRVFVDRLWPRGLQSDESGIDEWMKEIAPSDELRRWFRHRPERWAEFRRKYAEELDAPEKAGLVESLADRADRGNLTLLYGTRDHEHNNARVVEEAVRRCLEEPSPP